MYLKCTEKGSEHGQVLPGGDKTHGKLHRSPSDDKKSKIMNRSKFSEKKIARELPVCNHRGWAKFLIVSLWMNSQNDVWDKEYERDETVTIPDT